MAGWEHCKLIGDDLYFLGAGFGENRIDRHLTEAGAWDQIRDEGWELVAVAPVPKGEQLVHYFRRPWKGK